MPELELAVSATTRPRRPGEEDGRDYWFVSDEEFDRRLAEDDFLEWVELPWGPGYRSGTLWSELDRIRDRGRAPLLEIETGGALAVQQRIPEAVTIFVTAPSREEHPLGPLGPGHLRVPSAAHQLDLRRARDQRDHGNGKRCLHQA